MTANQKAWLFVAGMGGVAYLLFFRKKDAGAAAAAAANAADKNTPVEPGAEGPHGPDWYAARGAGQAAPVQNTPNINDAGFNGPVPLQLNLGRFSDTLSLLQ